MSRREPPGPSSEAKAQAKHAFFEDLDARLSAAGYAVPSSTVAAPAAPTPALSFEAWAELSVRFLESPEEALVQALFVRGLSLAVWRELDRAYHRALSDDLRAGRQERPALYAAKYKEEQARRSGAAREGAPPSLPTPAPADLRETNGVPDLPAVVLTVMGEAPFMRPAPEEAAPQKRSAKTVQSRVVPGGPLGETMDVKAALLRAAPTLPFTGSPGGGVVYVPPLDMRHYVALCAELLLKPAPPDETWRRYRVPNEAALRALDAHFRDPVRRAEVEVALAEFALVLRREVLR